MPDTHPSRLVLTPGVGSQIAMWACALLGVILAAGGIAEGADGIILVFGGCAFIVIGASTALSRATVSQAGITYWNLFRRSVPRSEIQGIRISEGSGAAYPRLAIWVDRAGSKPLRLTTLQVPDSDSGRRQIESKLASIKEILA